MGTEGVTGVNMSQTAMTNWSAGGENSVAGNAYLNGSLTHKSGDWLWVTNLVLDYGLSKTKSQGMRKSTDKIGLSNSWDMQPPKFGTIRLWLT